VGIVENEVQGRSLPRIIINKLVKKPSSFSRSIRLNDLPIEVKEALSPRQEISSLIIIKIGVFLLKSVNNLKSFSLITHLGVLY
jgi:hypothetical protein